MDQYIPLEGKRQYGGKKQDTHTGCLRQERLDLLFIEKQEKDQYQ
jgi:hypothetical protein